MFGLGSVAQVVTGGGVFGDYLSINLGFGLGVAMGVHTGGKVSGKLLKHDVLILSAEVISHLCWYNLEICSKSDKIVRLHHFIDCFVPQVPALSK